MILELGGFVSFVKSNTVAPLRIEVTRGAEFDLLGGLT